MEVTEDAYAPWNVGITEINVVNGEIKIKKVTQTKLPLISGNIQHVTQLLMGYRKIEELTFFDKITLSTPSLLEVGKYFPNQPQILNDYF